LETHHADGTDFLLILIWADQKIDN